MRVNGLYSAQVTLLCKQALMNRQHHFAAYLQRAVQQKIQCASDGALAGILHRYHAILNSAAFSRMKNIVDIRTWQLLYGAAETFQRRRLVRAAIPAPLAPDGESRHHP